MYLAKKILASHGAPASDDRLARTPEEAADLSKQIPGPVALKLASPDILHKSDAGGVKLKLCTPRDVKAAFRQSLGNAKKFQDDADVRGCVISPMAKPGLEVIIGTKVDDQFGPVIMYGLGGVMVEILQDVSFRVLPISRNSANKMIEETKSAPILSGVRGEPPYDKKSLVNLLLLCSELIESYPEIYEMDLNPVIVHEQGLSIVDARIILNPD